MPHTLQNNSTLRLDGIYLSGSAYTQILNVVTADQIHYFITHSALVKSISINKFS